MTNILEKFPDLFAEQSLIPEKISENTSDEEIATTLVTRIEVLFNFTQSLPTYNSLLEDWTSEEQELKTLIVDKVNPKLELRGLPTYQFAPVKTKKLKYKEETDFDPRFVLACNQVLDPTKSDSFAARIKLLQPLGITRATWNGWMKQEKYYDYANTLFASRFDRDLNLQADLALAKKIQDGDLNAIKFYKELTLRYNVPKEREIESNLNSMNIALIIATVLEIIAKHVDSRVIEAVANELETSPVGELLR